MKTNCSFLFFFEKHDWGRWDKKDLAMTTTVFNSARVVTATLPSTRTVQERLCKNCHKIQQEIICD